MAYIEMSELTDIWADRRVRIGYETAEELARKLNPANFRGHPESQAEALDDSIDLLGWIGSVKLNIQTDHIFDGELRIKRTLVKDPKLPIPVDYYDLSPDEELLALQVHDAITEQAEPIPDKLAALLERTRAMTADRPGLGAMLERLKERAGINGHQKTEEGPPQIDKAAELQKVWGVQVGDVWELGQHRLVCGDCTDRATVEAVMRGERAAMMFTDPPYNVDYGANANPPARVRSIRNDAMSRDEWLSFVGQWMSVLIEWCAGGIYICMSDKEMPNVTTSFIERGGHWSSYITWVKDRFVLGLKDYHSRHETMIYGWKEGISHVFYGGRDKDDVWEIPRPGNSQEHPTMKPVELVERAMGNSSKPGDICADFFLGSGTTIIAAENLGRKVRAIELDPGYCAVTLERWSQLTGQPPRRVPQGDTKRYERVA